MGIVADKIYRLHREGFKDIIDKNIVSESRGGIMLFNDYKRASAASYCKSAQSTFRDIGAIE